MPIIAVIQLKGGVGKSTIAANLAGELVQAERRVMLFDLDQQRSLSKWARRGDGVLNGRVQTMEVVFRRHDVFSAAVHRALEECDYVVLDCPPSFADAAVCSAMIADLALVPVAPSPLDIETAKETRDLMREARGKRQGAKPLVAFVPSRMTHTTWSRALVENLEKFGEIVLPGIGQRAAVVDSAATGLTLREYARGNKGVGEFQRLAEAVERTVGVQ